MQIEKIKNPTAEQDFKETMFMVHNMIIAALGIPLWADKEAKLHEFKCQIRYLFQDTPIDPDEIVRRSIGKTHNLDEAWKLVLHWRNSYKEAMRQNLMPWDI